jgi:tRNA A-37 threonylcarbamoyl transferase component Bud32/tetratricopeptide (TPR) repeat protein
LIGDMISHYKVTEKIGEGGMGIVYRAEDIKLGRRVALKFLPEEMLKNKMALERFLREARTAAAISHPHICTIYEIGEHEGRPFIAMEYIEGEPLSTRIEKNALPVDMVLEIGGALADALMTAHERGIIHRDIKPANIILTASDQPKILDFGLAKWSLAGEEGGDQDATLSAPNADLTARGTAMGTMTYMSPEQARGEQVDGRGDIFSLGVVLYEMATGRRAFTGNTAAVIFDQILNSSPGSVSASNPSMPHGLDQVVQKAIEKDRSLRYQSAADLKADLKRLMRDSQSQISVEAMPPAARSARAARDASASTISGVLPRGRLFWRVTFPVLVLVAALAAFLYLNRQSGAHALSDSDSIILTDFLNTTGDPVFDGTLRQALAVKLEESPYLNIIPEARVQQTLRFMNRSPDDPVTFEIGREVCQRQGVKAMMTGEIAALGSNYVITLNAVDCASGDVLAREQVEAESKETVLRNLGAAAGRMRVKLGESLASLERHDAPLEEATTSSLEALRLFGIGDRLRNSGQNKEEEAIPYYRRAIEQDPEFAMAYARLGAIYGNMKPPNEELSRQNRTKAFELRDRVSERERLYITAHYYNSVTGEVDRARETYELWIETYPRDGTPRNNLGIMYATQGQPEKAVEQYEAALEVESSSIYYMNAVDQNLGLNRLERAKEIGAKFISEFGSGGPVHRPLFMIAAFQNDPEAMALHAEAVEGTAFERDIREAQAGFAAYRGRMREFRRLVEELNIVHNSEGFSRSYFDVSLIEALLGNTEMAREQVRDVKIDELEFNDRIPAILTCALTGQTDRAKRALERLKKEPAPDEQLPRLLYPLVDSIIALEKGDGQESIDLLADLGSFETNQGQGGHMVTYTRGAAYLELGKGREAAAEFQKVIERRYLDMGGVQNVLAQLGLARALAMAGDLEQSRAAYEALFQQWKDADPDLPPLVQARAEYAKLSGI